jgi:hypothetical protein
MTDRSDLLSAESAGLGKDWPITTKSLAGFARAVFKSESRAKNLRGLSTYGGLGDLFR